MVRWIPLLAFVALAVGIFLMPAADPNELAAHQGGALLLEPARTPDGPEEPAPDALPLWRYLTEGSAAERREDGTVVVRVRGYRMSLEGSEEPDHYLHAILFKSIKRTLRSIASGEDFAIEFEEVLREDFPGAVFFGARVPDGLVLEVQLPDGTATGVQTEWHPPSVNSLVPPLIAIAVAILLRKAAVALLAGVVAGALLVRLHVGQGLLAAASGGLADVPLRYFRAELTDQERVMIILFVVFMLSMVGVMTRAGGIRGLMDLIARLANGARRSQVASWLMGLAVFFDDYANTILVGSTMRPLTDRFRVAREKLAYIVDSTAAPVAGISIFSTWIAFEVSTFSAQLPDAGLAISDGYSVFLQTLPFRFYCLLTIFFVGLLVLTGRDFGPMLTAERRARGGAVLRKGAQPLVSERATSMQPARHVVPLARVALWPLGTFIGVTLVWILYKGGAFTVLQPGRGFESFGELLSLRGMTTVLYDGSGSTSLAVGALSGLGVAAVMAWIAGLSREIPAAAWSSLRSMGIAILILYLAWMIGAVCRELGTAQYLTVLLGTSMNPLVLPAVLFFLAGAVAFSTGSSWSTMSIILPLVVGLSYELGHAIPLGGPGLLVISIGAVLEGSIFGDHCSPISDTTVMSSIASASDHVDHVRTQAPYALTTMVVAMLCGYFPAVMLQLNPWLCLLLGMAVLTGIVLWYGERVAEPELPPDPADEGAAAEVPVEAK